MRRTVLGSVIAAAVLAAAGLTLTTHLMSPAAGGLVVRGRVTGTGDKPVSGIKVWLNAVPTSPAASVEQSVTVVDSALTSANGTYTLRVPSLSALAPDVVNGVVDFNLMTGNRTGWDLASFPSGLSGGTVAVPLQLH
jgi:hypothetical protein